MSDHGMKLIGTVSREYHPASSWVKVSVMQVDGIPLSLKAHRGSFAKELFVKGRTVEVTQSCHQNTYRFSVTEVYSTQKDWAEAEERVMEKVRLRKMEEGHPCVKHGCRKERWKDWEAEEVGCRRDTGGKTGDKTTRFFEEEEDKPTEDHVSFYIGSRYYNSMEQQKKLKPVLIEALNMTGMEANSFMQDYGFWVVCRASQFAKFMVYRDRAGICNGFIDMRVQIEGSHKKTNQINVVGRG